MEGSTNSTSKRRSKNLFKTALDKLVGKHVDNVYKVTVIYNNDGDNQEANYNSAQNISIHNNHKKSSEKNDEPPKVPPRRKSRTSSQTLIKALKSMIYSKAKI